MKEGRRKSEGVCTVMSVEVCIEEIWEGICTILRGERMREMRITFMEEEPFPVGNGVYR